MKKILKRLCTGVLALATVVTTLPSTTVHAENKQYWTQSNERVGIVEKVMNDGSIGCLLYTSGHIILHRSQLKMAPMQDDTLYNMTDNTEYQANLFAADLLIEDEEIEDMVQNEDLDYFGLCSSLNATPELMSFKLYSLTKRGQAYHMPMEIQSNFLAK